MNSTVKLALASALSIASISGAALAQTPAPAPAPAPAPMVDSTTTTASTTTMAEGVSIVRLDSLNNDQNRQQHTRLKQISMDQAATAEAQAAVSADPAMSAAMTAESVELINIIHVDTAANGGKIVYIR